MLTGSLLNLPASFFDSISSSAADISASVEREWRKISVRQVHKVILKVRFILPPMMTSTTALAKGLSDTPELVSLREQFQQVRTFAKSILHVLVLLCVPTMSRFAASPCVNIDNIALHGVCFAQFKKLEGQYHDVCKQYTASVMENKKLLRQLDLKNKAIEELKQSVVESTGTQNISVTSPVRYCCMGHC